MYETRFIEAKTLGEAWEKSCVLLMTEGHDRYVEAPEYKTSTKDLPLIIKVSEPFSEPRLSPKVNTNREQADDYAKKLIFGSGKEKENSFEYTYYSRLRCYPDCKVRAFLPSFTDSEEELKEAVSKISADSKCVVERIDQVDKAIKILQKDPSRRTVVLHTWIPYRDLMKFGPRRENTSSPCVVLVYPQIVDEKMHMFVVMKTNDLYNAWPENAYALTALQKYMADQIGVGVGTYTHFSVSMQIYQDVYEEAKRKFNL
jgi:thymidylate synthase